MVGNHEDHDGRRGSDQVTPTRGKDEDEGSTAAGTAPSFPEDPGGYPWYLIGRWNRQAWGFSLVLIRTILSFL